MAEKVKTAFNRGILEETQPVDLLKTLELLSKVIGNLVKFPDELKYRRIAADNKTFNDVVINSKGGLDFVVACGFKKKDVDGIDLETPLLSLNIQESFFGLSRVPTKKY
jgi:hypothetical protein